MDYCISDIHGCSKTLSALLGKLALTADDTVYFLGDYVDRGPDSKGVLDIVMAMSNAVCHKGNHEDMMVKALLNLDNDEYQWHWGVNGGKKCMESFGNNVEQKYLDFLCGLKLITELPGFYLCHAGIGWDAMNTPEKVLLWDRDLEVDVTKSGGRRLICGHTPTPLEIIKDELWVDKVIIDAGCVFSSCAEYGSLIALRLDDMQIFEQRNIDM